MIGIGVTSMNDEKYNTFIENLDANTSEFKFASARNIKGVRKAKNQLLHELRDCDHIFLFDEDCYPIKPGWVDFCIEVLKGCPHFQYNTSEIHGKMTEFDGKLITFNGGGVFLALTKEVLETVGYMSPEYQGYGWEHLGYSYRIYRHGLTINPYVCPVGLDGFLHAEDYVRPMAKELSEEDREQRDKNYHIFIKEAHELKPKRVLYGA